MFYATLKFEMFYWCRKHQYFQKEFYEYSSTLNMYVNVNKTL